MDTAKKVFWDTKKDRTISIIVLSVVGGLIIFKLGMFAGYHKALFSYQSDNRHFMFSSSGVAGGMMLPAPGFAREEFSTSHGATGRVVSVSLPTFVIASPDNKERTIMVGDRTMVRRFQNTVPATDIRADDFTVVLGNPDDAGRIQAKFIRLTDGNMMYGIDATSTR